ncbi:hypothetical protein FPQ18DRAFT_277663 [Pyronema domesticum]|uniref:Similar to GDSL esterase/lipase At2g04570 acc. no. Q9SJB4 n=1 Tax=Pyronema omphalodes (strain CBS 100304) TaxID=1076935 RepID=U4LPF5_PYROM|nr:hypothetical protein FPQ18DRAFT_277663 [Pyronema domesticum]CCX16515.1 Similar to GDSL esterase/lipase At2g04570; acc. no. Q9SJB4 [Pyronema omphalodes CBS 100304]
MFSKSLFTIVSAASLASAGVIPSWLHLGLKTEISKDVKYYFSFGDSYTQTGFNLTDGSPLPSPSNPMGNPVYPGWTSANGPNWIDYLTSTYNASTTVTYNMAYGGATIDSNLVVPYRPEVRSIVNQVEDFFLGQIQARKLAPWTAENSLFLIWIGINDIGNSYWKTTGDGGAFHQKLMASYFAEVNKLYTAGARKFLFVDVPRIERAPLTADQGATAIALEAEAVTSYNSLLSKNVQAFQAKPGVRAMVFSSAATFNRILDNPGVYGFANATGYCDKYGNGTPEPTTYYPECGVSVDKYVWLNNLHPTWPVHKILAREMAAVADIMVGL